MKKQCTRCGEVKPWDAFHAAVKWEDGTMRRPQSRCKRCLVELNSERQRRLRREQPKRMRRLDRKRWKALKKDEERMELWRARHRDYQAKRRRAAGKPERPLCSPYGRERARAEVVPVGPFIEWLHAQAEPITVIAERAGVNERSLRRIRDGEQENVSLDVVDRVLMTCDGDLDALYPLAAA